MRDAGALPCLTPGGHVTGYGQASTRVASAGASAFASATKFTAAARLATRQSGCDCWKRCKARAVLPEKPQTPAITFVRGKHSLSCLTSVMVAPNANGGTAETQNISFSCGSTMAEFRCGAKSTDRGVAA